MTQQPVPVSRQRVQSALRRAGHYSAARSSGGYQVSEEGGQIVVRYSTPHSRYSDEYAARVREQLLGYQAALERAGIPSHIPNSPGRVPWLVCTPAPEPAPGGAAV